MVDHLSGNTALFPDEADPVAALEAARALLDSTPPTGYLALDTGGEGLVLVPERLRGAVDDSHQDEEG